MIVRWPLLQIRAVHPTRSTTGDLGWNTVIAVEKKYCFRTFRISSISSHVLKVFSSRLSNLQTKLSIFVHCWLSNSCQNESSPLMLSSAYAEKFLFAECVRVTPSYLSWWKRRQADMHLDTEGRPSFFVETNKGKTSGLPHSGERSFNSALQHANVSFCLAAGTFHTPPSPKAFDVFDSPRGKFKRQRRPKRLTFFIIIFLFIHTVSPLGLLKECNSSQNRTLGNTYERTFWRLQLTKGKSTLFW